MSARGTRGRALWARPVMGGMVALTVAMGLASCGASEDPDPADGEVNETSAAAESAQSSEPAQASPEYADAEIPEGAELLYPGASVPDDVYLAMKVKYSDEAYTDFYDIVFLRREGKPLVLPIRSEDNYVDLLKLPDDRLFIASQGTPDFLIGDMVQAVDSGEFGYSESITRDPQTGKIFGRYRVPGGIYSDIVEVVPEEASYDVKGISLSTSIGLKACGGKVFAVDQRMGGTGEGVIDVDTSETKELTLADDSAYEPPADARHFSHPPVCHDGALHWIITKRGDMEAPMYMAEIDPDSGTYHVSAQPAWDKGIRDKQSPHGGFYGVKDGRFWYQASGDRLFSMLPDGTDQKEEGALPKYMDMTSFDRRGDQVAQTDLGGNFFEEPSYLYVFDLATGADLVTKQQIEILDEYNSTKNPLVRDFAFIGEAPTS